MSRTYVAAALACIVTQVGFGGYGIVLKMFAEAAHENAVIFSFFRDGCCFPVLLLAACISERHLRLPSSSQEMKVFALLGVSGMWGNQLFYILGLYYTSASVASCWQPAIPVFAAMIAIATRVEPFPPLSKLRGWLKLGGIALAAAGALVLTLSKSTPETVDFSPRCKIWMENLYGAGALAAEEDVGSSWSNSSSGTTGCRCPGPQTGSNATVAFLLELCPKSCGACGANAATKNVMLGNVFLFLNCFCMASYLVLQRHFIFGPRGALHDTWSAHPLFVTAHSYFFGALAMVVTGVVGFYAQVEFLGFKKGGDYDHWSLPAESVIPLVYAVFVSSALCYGLITYANKQIGPTVTTAFWPLQVPVAVFLASCDMPLFHKSGARCDAGYHEVHPAANTALPDFGTCKPLCEELNSGQYLGAGLIAVGLLFVTYAKRLEDSESADVKVDAMAYRDINTVVPIARMQRISRGSFHDRVN